jgi:phosphotriesterase-related protein
MVQTVRGELDGSEMGVTLPHEHVFIDLSAVLSQPVDPTLGWLVDAKVSMNIIGHLLHHATSCRDNLIIDDPDLAVKELEMYKNLGGRTVVDVSSRGLAPRPLELRKVSERTGLNIIMGCGYYVARSHPKDMRSRSMGSIADEIIRDIKEGVDGTDVRAGIIGEIGTSHPVTESEWKVLRAAAQAQKSTGVALNVHMNNRGKHGLEVIKLLESEGVDPARIILSHQDELDNPTLEYYAAVAERGAYVEFDCFGEEDYAEEFDYVHPRDTRRMEWVSRIIDAGYIDNLLISQDVCYKTYMREYGGYGYDHILRTIVPLLRRKYFVADEEVQQMMVENPRRAIA